MKMNWKLLVGLGAAITSSQSFAIGACDDYTLDRTQVFEQICRTHYSADGADSTIVLNDVDKATMDYLYEMYKADTNHDGNEIHTECLSIQRHWDNKYLDLSGKGRMSIPLVLKMDGVSSLNLSNAGLLSCDAQELLEGSGTSAIITDSLESLDLSNNKITSLGEADLNNWPDLVKLDLSKNDLQFTEGTPAFRFSGSKLFYLDLSQNPNLKIIDRLSSDFYMGLNYVDVSGIDTLRVDSLLGITGRNTRVLYAENVGTVTTDPEKSITPLNLLFFSFHNSNMDELATAALDGMIRDDLLPKYAQFDLKGTSLQDVTYSDRETVEMDVAVTPSAEPCDFPAADSIVQNYSDFQVSLLFDSNGRLKETGFCGRIQSELLGLDAENFTVGLTREFPVFKDQLK